MPLKLQLAYAITHVTENFRFSLNDNGERSRNITEVIKAKEDEEDDKQEKGAYTSSFTTFSTLSGSMEQGVFQPFSSFMALMS